MTSSTTRRLSALAAASLFSAAAAIPAFAAGPVSVTVNGNPANLNPPPTERAGRVFVPLRGVFEQLGASVVYQSGVINATGRGHNISLKIGSQQATVDGQQQNVDVAPFIIGASTYVPLRFVSQALGATVNYDGGNRVVAINTNGAAANNAPNQTITPAPAAQGGGGAITLASEQPVRGTTVTARRPTIGATFGGGLADPSTVRITLDGTDITNQSTRSPRGFLYVPSGPLTPGQHRVGVSGTDTNGNPFTRGWGFSSGTSSASAGQILNLRPTDGSTVGTQFTVSGRTTPGAHVTIQVGASSGRTTSVAGILGALLGAGNQNSTASGTAVADGNGRFSQVVNINAPSGTQLQL
ncbi:MAG TPA: copper amine oxidase N-terminal domain-containing protein, partial [Candidatus Elarobacter sp.]